MARFKTAKTVLFLVSFAVLCAAGLSNPARADCTGPPGVEGDMTYAANYKTMVFCDGTNWVSMRGGSVGGSGSNINPNPFDFTDVTNAAPHSEYTDTAVLTGFSGVQIAAARGAVIRNATISSIWGSTATITDGDTLEIRMNSGDTFSETVTADVTLGTMTVDWAITTVASGPSDCSSIGDVCNDGSVFVGDSNLYLATNISEFSDWSTETVDTGADSLTDGAANQQWIVDNETLSQYPLFELCENLFRHGHSDWYLPARDELAVLYNNKAVIGLGDEYLSSTEVDNYSVWAIDFESGSLSPYTEDKDDADDGVCVRRD
jgi:hypothetical protein